MAIQRLLAMYPTLLLLWLTVSCVGETSYASETDGEYLVDAFNPNICGKFQRVSQRTGGHHGRIHGGSPAPRGLYPSYVLMTVVEESNPDGTAELHQCGAVIISPDLVLTSASCVTLYESGYIKRGPVFTGGLRYEVSRICRHPRYRKCSGGVEHDLAVVRLKRRLSYDFDASPVCWNVTQEIPNTLNLTIVGSGAAIGGKLPEYPNYPLSEPMALNMVRNCYVGELQQELKTSTCLYHYDKNTIGVPCDGDYGGPVYMESEGKEWLMGILSYGLDKKEQPCTGYNGYVAYVTDFSKMSDLDVLINECRDFAWPAPTRRSASGDWPNKNGNKPKRKHKRRQPNKSD